MSFISFKTESFLARCLFFLFLFLHASLNASSSRDRQVSNFFKDFCLDCHNNKKQKGKINLENLNLIDPSQDWDKILSALENFEMPPEDEKQPTDSERLDISKLIKLQAAKEINPGYVSMRRMTRLEYDNSIKDLLNLKTPLFVLPDRVIRERKSYFDPASGKMPDEIDLISRMTQHGVEPPYFAGVSSLPIDPKAEHGFENNARVTTLSPLLMEKYLTVAKSLLNSPSFPGKSLDWNEVFKNGQEDVQLGAKKRLSILMRKAFRKKLDPEQVDKYTHFFMTRYHQKNSFTEAMKETVSVILSSPEFIFVNKLDYSSKQPEPLNAQELANRLALFLWGSLPDEELLKFVDSNQLIHEDVLAQQTQRMLKDKRIKYLSYSFAMQWMNLKQMMSVSPDSKLFNDFYFDKRYLQRHVGQFSIIEPLLLFETILVEDRSILEFLDTNYTYLNKSLRQWYGYSQEKKVKDTSDFIWKRQALPNRKRGGIVTSGAFLTMTSTPERSSPINRGAWITSVLFNSPPPPPPADVPALDEKESSKDFKTIRERFEEHRKNPNCASCHNKIDPLGFSLENYNAVGQWRDHYPNNLAIDSSGTYQKKSFKDVISFKDVLLENKERFAKGFIEHMLAFSLNRETQIYDNESIEKISKNISVANFKFSEVILEIVKSYPFRNKVQEDK